MQHSQMFLEKFDHLQIRANNVNNQHVSTRWLNADNMLHPTVLRSFGRGLTLKCFPFDLIVFAMLPAHGNLAGNSFIVRCHVTMN